jgi:cytochrome P450
MCSCQWCGGHVYVAHAAGAVERIDDRVHHGRARANRARLAGSLDAERVCPFGGGPRICIGNRFAMMEAILITATIAQRFRLEGQNDRPVIPFPSITLRPGGGVWVTTKARV